MIKRQGHYFLRGGLRDIPAQLPLVGDDDVLPRDWGSLNRRLYRMFHSTVLPTILRNFDRLSMAHGIEVRMPFMDWRLVTYTMALAGDQQVIERLYQGHCAAGDGQPDAGIHPHGTPEGRIQFADAGVVERASRRLDRRLLDRKVPAFAELVDEGGLRKTVGRLTSSNMGLGVGRPDLAVSEYEMGNGTGRVI